METTAKGSAPFRLVGGAAPAGASGTGARLRDVGARTPARADRRGRRNVEGKSPSRLGRAVRARASAAARSSGSGDTRSSSSSVNGCRSLRRCACRNCLVARDPDAVDGIAAHRQADRLEMHPDLVCAPGFETNLEQRAPTEELLRLEPRAASRGVVGVEGVPCPVVAIAADRRLDPACSRPRRAVDEREIAPLDLPVAGSASAERDAPVRSVRRASARRCRGRAGGRCPDDPPLHPPPRAPSTPWTSVPEPLEPTGWTTMPGRLVDHEQVLVRPDHRDLERLGLEGRRGASSTTTVSPAASRWLLRAVAVDPDEHPPRQALGGRAGADLGARREDAIEPLARLGLRNAKAERRQRVGSTGRPRRTRGRAGRHRRR